MSRLTDVIERRATTWLVLGAIAAFLLLLAISLGLYPVVFADEYTYSKYARLAPLAESPVPGYLYLLIYRATNVCGSGFLSCARMLNAFLFVSTAPFIYLVARLVADRLAALVVALLAIAAPINSYTVYFMPEAAYFFAFWAFVAVLFAQRFSTPVVHYAICGVVLGLAALIKPHALFLLPAVILLIAYLDWRTHAGWPRSILTNAAVFVLAVGVVKFGVSYFLAGRSGLTIFGSLYNSVTPSPPADFKRLLSYLSLAAESFRGHVLGITVLLGLPLAISILSLRDDSPTDDRRTQLRAIVLFFLSAITTMILIAAFFSASLTQSLNDNIARLHMRYYNFLFPGLLIIVAAHATMISDQRPLLGRLAVAVPFGAIITYALVTRLDRFVPSFVDSPELRGISVNSTFFWIIGALSLSSLALWACQGRSGARLFVFVCMPLCVAVSWYFVVKDQRPRINPDVYDRAGLFVRQFLPEEERDRLVVVGDNLAAVLRTMFLVDSRFVRLQRTSEAEPNRKPAVPTGTHWVLSFDDSPPATEVFFWRQMPGFVLARLMTDLTFDFAAPPSLGIVEKATGLFGPEPGGSWSNGKLITLQFAGRLPETFALRLVSHAFGPNVGERAVVRIGDSSAEFELSATTGEQVIEIQNPARLATLTIEVPTPTSPSELGAGNDHRKLGLKLSSIAVIPTRSRASP